MKNKKDEKSMKQESLENVAGGFSFGDFKKSWSKGLEMVKVTASALDSTVSNLNKAVDTIGKTVNKAKSDFGTIK